MSGPHQRWCSALVTGCDCGYEARLLGLVDAARAAAPPVEPRGCRPHGRNNCALCPPDREVGLREALIEQFREVCEGWNVTHSDYFLGALADAALLASDKPGLDVERRPACPNCGHGAHVRGGCPTCPLSERCMEGPTYAELADRANWAARLNGGSDV